MKKYLTIPILFLISLSSFAQSPEWFELGATWTYNWNGVADPDQVDYTYDYSVTEITEHLGETCSKIEAEDGAFSCLVYQAPYYMYKSNDTIYFATDEMNSFAIGYVLSDGAEWQYEVNLDGNSSVFNVSVTDIYTTDIDGIDLPTYTIEYDAESGDFVDLFPSERTVVQYLGDLNMFIIPFGKNGACDFEINEVLRCYSSATLSYQNPDFSSCTLGIGEVNRNSEFKVYPNPAQNQITIQPVENGFGANAIVQIRDASGRLVLSVPLSNQSVDVSGLNSGLYLLQVFGSGESLGSAKLVVE
jgi:hypothetical protein